MENKQQETKLKLDKELEEFEKESSLITVRELLRASFPWFLGSFTIALIVGVLSNIGLKNDVEEDSQKEQEFQQDEEEGSSNVEHLSLLDKKDKSPDEMSEISEEAAPGALSNNNENVDGVSNSTDSPVDSRPETASTKNYNDLVDIIKGIEEAHRENLDTIQKNNKH